MDTNKNDCPATQGDDMELLGLLSEASARAAAGDTVGWLAFELHPDGTATRHVIGAARIDRHRIAGMAMELAQRALSPAQ
ncbi:hypothetical protein EV699_12023 [Plasticicumulans lactativorans]|uniref:Uncharacterized protein n=1 Tax=Plasticicumulans lactativorans TaxID=1133106 RepID=A0A4R2LIS4_9GAMM|nr:hypothetical protein [Plasticicumulans lactativorans]TCO79245.1 hypothetical protein EV699_12023 [Plasticicumulans lactativorans]